ncbi:MAG: NlpC/P60 family protein [Anaerovoracaceae bacterium]
MTKKRKILPLLLVATMTISAFSATTAFGASAHEGGTGGATNGGLPPVQESLPLPEPSGIAEDKVQNPEPSPPPTTTEVQGKEEVFTPAKIGRITQRTYVHSTYLNPSLIRIAQPGEELTVQSAIEYSGITWYKASLGDQIVYINSDSVTLYENTAVETPFSPTKIGKISQRTYVHSTYLTASLVDIAQPNETLTIQASIEYSGITWYKASLGDQIVYINSDSVTLYENSGAETPFSPEKIGKISQHTYVHSTYLTPSLIRIAQPGEQFTIQASIEYSGITWYKASLGDQIVYINSDSVTLYENSGVETPFETARLAKITQRTYVHSTYLSPSLVTIASPNTRFTIYSSVEYLGVTWYKTTYGGQWVYINSDAMHLYDENGTETPYAPEKTAYITQSTYIHSTFKAPSRVATYGANEQIKVYSVIEYYDTTWYKTTYGGQWAYVNADSVYLGTTKLYQNPSPYRQLSLTPIPVRPSGYTLNVGMSGMKVYTIQNYLGVYNGKAYYTQTTAAAVSAFQRRHNLPVTGSVDYATWSAMGFSWDSFYYLDSYVSPLRTTIISDKADHIEAMISTAETYLGTKYVWCASAAPGLGIDCTGLIFQAFYGTGIDPTPLGSHSYAYWSNQYSSRLLWEDDSYLHVNFSDRKRGDIIVYADNSGKVFHVALYLGNNRIIEASPSHGVTRSSVYAYSIKGVIRPII